MKGILLSLSGDFADLATTRIMDSEGNIPPNPFNGTGVIAFYDRSGKVVTHVLEDTSMSKCLSALNDQHGVDIDRHEPFAAAVQYAAGQRFQSNSSTLHEVVRERLTSLC